MYLDNLNTYSNDNCFSSGPLSASEEYQQIKGYGPIEEQCYDAKKDIEYNFPCRKYYDSDAGSVCYVSTPSYSGDLCLDINMRLFYRYACVNEISKFDEEGFVYYSLSGFYFWVSAEDYKEYLEDYGTSKCEVYGPMIEYSYLCEGN